MTPAPSYLWPPRAEIAIDRVSFAQYASWWVTIKKEGTCNVMDVGADRRVTAMNRHRQRHKAWQPSELTRRAFLDLPGTGRYVFEAELMHSKVPGLRNINYIHDILVANGDYLVGITYAERQQMLLDLFKPTVRSLTNSHWIIDPYTWLAINHRDDGDGKKFISLFQNLKAREDEGLVFKDPQAKLRFCATPTANSSWQVKSRRPSKTHGH